MGLFPIPLFFIIFVSKFYNNMANHVLSLEAPDDLTRKCYSCKENYYLTGEYFYKDKQTKHGLSRICKKCSSENQKIRIKLNPKIKSIYNKICNFKNCKKEFKTTNILQKYCCLSCGRIDSKSIRRGYYSEIGNSLICKGCKISFIKKQRVQIYCTITCSKQHFGFLYYENNKEKWNTPEIKLKNFSRNPYRKYKKDKCEDCGFFATHSCQLDVDHIDGNHKNNNPFNLKTLCANCHRLKTFLNKEGCYRPNKKVRYES